jgi:hypothetical protein
MLENLEPLTPLRTCKVRTVMDTLETKDREILSEALVDPRWRPNSLSVALKQRGIDLANKLIRKHQVGDCTCPKIGS